MDALKIQVFFIFSVGEKMTVKSPNYPGFYPASHQSCQEFDPGSGFETKMTVSTFDVSINRVIDMFLDLIIW